MRKVIELLKVYVLDWVRNPMYIAMSLTWGLGFFLFLYFVFETGGLDFGGSRSFGPLFVSSYLVFIPAFISINGTLNGLLQDSEKGVLKAYRASRLTKPEYFASKIVAASISSLVLSSIMLILAFFMAGMSFSYGITLLTVLTTVVAHSGIAFIAASLSRNTEGTQMLSQFFMMLFIVGTPVFYPQTMLPDQLTVVQQLIPLTHSIEIMRAMAQNALTQELLVQKIGILLGFTAVLLGTGYRRFKF